MDETVGHQQAFSSLPMQNELENDSLSPLAKGKYTGEQSHYKRGLVIFQLIQLVRKPKVSRTEQFYQRAIKPNPNPKHFPKNLISIDLLQVCGRFFSLIRDYSYYIHVFSGLRGFGCRMGWSIHITCSTSVSLEPIMQPTLVVMWFASTVEPVMIKATCLKQPLINFTYIQTSIQRPPSTNRPQFFGPWVATLDRSHCTCASSPQGSSVAGRCRAEAHAQVRSDDTAWTGSC